MALDSTVMKTFEELPEEKQIEVIDFIMFLSNTGNKKSRDKKVRNFPFNALKGKPYYVSDDFDEPLEDFKEYM